uniref:Hira domain-containing protein n=1 Tax=Heterorhabditis bacteriophora TaxID=37862 RepID=A0A1I7XBN5_HETBA
MMLPIIVPSSLPVSSEAVHQHAVLECISALTISRRPMYMRPPAAFCLPVVTLRNDINGQALKSIRLTSMFDVLNPYMCRDRNEVHEISRAMLKHREKHLVCARRLEHIHRFVMELEVHLSLYFGTRVNLQIYGSTINGFGTKHCDVDMSLSFFPHPPQWAQCADTVMRAVAKALVDYPNGYDERYISAKVPIVRFRGREMDIEADISYSNDLAIHNTNLLRQYCRWDEIRLPTLGVWIKKWAKRCGIGDASKGSLSSYAWTVMLIHYLQRIEPGGLLPYLQQIPHHPKEDVYILGWNVYFWKFVDVVQITSERIILKSERWKKFPLCIADPFEKDHNLGQSVDDNMFKYIRSCLEHSRRVFTDSKLRSEFLNSKGIKSDSKQIEISDAFIEQYGVGSVMHLTNPTWVHHDGIFSIFLLSLQNYTFPYRLSRILFVDMISRNCCARLSKFAFVCRSYWKSFTGYLFFNYLFIYLITSFKLSIQFFSDDTPNKMNSTFIDTPEGLLAKRKVFSPSLSLYTFLAESDSSKDVSKPPESDVPLSSAAHTFQQAEILTEQRKQQIEMANDEYSRYFWGRLLIRNHCHNLLSNNSGSKSPSPKKRHVDASTDDSTAAESSDDEMDTSEGESTAKEYSIDKPGGGTEKRDELDRRTMMMMYDFKKPTMRPIESSRIEVSDASTVLDLPEQQLTMSETVQGVLGDIIEVNNEWAHGGVRSSRIAYSRAHVQQWTAYVGPPVAISVANRLWVAVGCFDRSMRVFASASGRLQCALQLDSAPVRMGLNGHKILCANFLRDFCFGDKRIIVIILQANLTSISVTISGMPLLGFSTGNLFTYSVDLQCWQLVDSVTGLLKLSDSISGDELPDGQLGKLLKRRKRPGPIANVPLGVRSSIKETMLEGWLLSAETTGSAQDYKGILITYVQQLVRNRTVIKLKEVLRRIEGSGTICGISRSALRADIERIICVDPATSSLLKKDADGKPEVF